MDTRDRQPINQDIDQWRWYVRVKTSINRTDTLIAIATVRYWRDADERTHSSNLRNGWQPLIGNQELYYCNLAEPPKRARDLEATITYWIWFATVRA